MNKGRGTTVVFFFVLSLALSGGGGWGCGGGAGGGNGADEVNVGSGTGEAAQDALTTLDSVGDVVSTSLTVSTPTALTGSLSGLSVDQHVHCDGAQAAVTGTIDGDATGGTFNLDVSFNNCFSLDGTVGFSGSYTSDGETLDFSVGFDGDVGGSGCLLELDSLVYSFTASQGVIAAPLSESLGGTLTGNCTEPNGTASLSCDWGEGIEIDNQAALIAACDCSGAGCGE